MAELVTLINPETGRKKITNDFSAERFIALGWELQDGELPDEADDGGGDDEAEDESGSTDDADTEQE